MQRATIRASDDRLKHASTVWGEACFATRLLQTAIAPISLLLNCYLLHACAFLGVLASLHWKASSLLKEVYGLALGCERSPMLFQF